MTKPENGVHPSGSHRQDSHDSAFEEMLEQELGAFDEHGLFLSRGL